MATEPEPKLRAYKGRVRDLAGRFGREHPARDPDGLAAAIGATLQYGELGEQDGAFDPNRRVVLLNRAAGAERQRFTAAHEITHALILADDDLLSDLHDDFEGDELETAIETLCNVGASAILAPQSELEAALERYGRGARAVPRIAAGFGLSRAAACVTLAEHLETRAIVSVLRSRGGKGTARRLEVDFAARTDAMKYGLAPGTVMPDDHAAVIAFETGLEIEKKDFVPFRSGRRMPALVDAHPEGNLVYAVFTLPEA